MAQENESVMSEQINLRFTPEMIFRMKIAAKREGKALRPFIREVMAARLEGMNIPKVSTEEELAEFNKAEAEAAEKRSLEARLLALQKEMEVIGAKLAS